MQQIVLGTAQFGLGYGVTNTKGRLSDDDIAAIMAVALERGIADVDTAAGYGDAHLRLRPWAADLRITTKVAGRHPDQIPALVGASLEELAVVHLDAVLVHDWHDLDAPQRAQVAEVMGDLREQGMVGQVGVSGYEEADLASALDAFDVLDIVQVPANALDRRLDDSPSVQRLSREGAEIQVRSVFLQGVLAGPSDTAQGRHPAVLAFLAECAHHDRSPLAAALAHVRALPWATQVLVGVTSADELRDVLDAWQSAEPALAARDLASDDLGLLDPRTWAKP